MLEEKAVRRVLRQRSFVKEDAMNWIWGLIFLALYWLSHLLYL